MTSYDDGTGERVELSVATYANWVAKTASLLQDEVGLVHGDRLLVDLPAHWLGPVWVGAAWSLGVVLTPPGSATPAGAVVCGPAGIDQYAGAAAAPGHAAVPVVALSLLPMATRFPTPLPDGVLDYGLVVWGQPDAFAAYDPVLADDPAWEDASGSLTQTEVCGLELVGAGSPVRLLTDLHPVTRAGLAAFVEPLRTGGGTVWVTQAGPDSWDDRTVAEHATAVVRA